jgi:hypothetical protein
MKTDVTKRVDRDAKPSPWFVWLRSNHKAFTTLCRQRREYLTFPSSLKRARLDERRRDLNEPDRAQTRTRVHMV